MKIGIPEIGKLTIPLAGLFRRAGWELVLPDREESRVLELANQHAPEEWGLPLRLQLGSYIAALESGAELLLMTSGCCSCRGDVNRQKQKKILRQAGYDFQGVDLDLSLTGIFSAIRQLITRRQLFKLVTGLVQFWWKVRFLSDLEEKRLALGNYMSAYEQERYSWILEELTYRVFTDDIRELSWEAEALFEVLEGRRQEGLCQKGSLQIGLVGDLSALTVAESVWRVQSQLLDQGVAIEQPSRLDQWLREIVWPGNKMKRSLRRGHDLLMKDDDQKVQQQVGHLVQCSQRNCAGVIQIVTCGHSAPCQESMQKVARELGVPLFRLNLNQGLEYHQLDVKLNAFISLLNVERKSVENLNSVISM